jgi:hypothetical protein
MGFVPLTGIHQHASAASLHRWLALVFDWQERRLLTPRGVHQPYAWLALLGSITGGIAVGLLITRVKKKRTPG